MTMGTGKTFLWTTITSYLRSQGKVVLIVAASGIASLLLPSGRTAHSRFKIPIDLTGDSNCNVSKNTQLSQLLVEAELIIWDEVPMSDRKCFEALDRTLKDILDNNNDPFSGKSILLGGDFRQTLPVKPKASKFKIFRLTQNMRVNRPNMSPEDAAEITEFSKWLLDIGNGLCGFPDDRMNEDSKVVHIPKRYIIPYDKDSMLKLVRFIYDNDTLQSPTPSDLAHKAIVCPKNKTADLINDVILDMLPGTPTTYQSTDLAVPHTKNHTDLETLYPSEYLTTLNIAGFPPHELKLKVNVPIILLRNINQKTGLCSGTRLLITQLLPRLIEARGDAIEAVASARNMESLINSLHIGRCYRIQNYICTGKRHTMRTVNHEASIRLTRYTSASYPHKQPRSTDRYRATQPPQPYTSSRPRNKNPNCQ
ncbi:uncharacterized protein LOC143532186 [Bidens hawaiensis]|uniref:uncharacterized protein LOC143532186 n=1 Tax=Bidens hawaiensis TaxID=980011 RepID=UPI00404A0C44